MAHIRVLCADTHSMRIYASYAHLRRMCAYTDNMSMICAYMHNMRIIAIIYAECADAHNPQQRTCAYAHYAPLRIVCAEYASAHNIRGEGQRNTPVIFAHSAFSYFVFRGRRQLPQAGEGRRPRRARGVVEVVGRIEVSSDT